jgi:hypothetical protein
MRVARRVVAHAGDSARQEKDDDRGHARSHLVLEQLAQRHAQCETEHRALQGSVQRGRRVVSKHEADVGARYDFRRNQDQQSRRELRQPDALRATWHGIANLQRALFDFRGDDLHADRDRKEAQRHADQQVLRIV